MSASHIYSQMLCQLSYGEYSDGLDVGENRLLLFVRSLWSLSPLWPQQPALNLRVTVSHHGVAQCTAWLQHPNANY